MSNQTSTMRPEFAVGPDDAFTRQQRYLVIKLPDIHKYLSTAQQNELFALADAVAKRRDEDGRKELAAVVIESDWPEYEPVWSMVEARCRAAYVPAEQAVTGSNHIWQLPNLLPQEEGAKIIAELRCGCEYRFTMCKNGYKTEPDLAQVHFSHPDCTIDKEPTAHDVVKWRYL